MPRYALGIDYGTNSVRALIVDTSSGEEVGTGVVEFPSGDHGVILDARDPHLARQNPSDYIDGFFDAMDVAVADASRHPDFSAADIVGIGVDTTGSTPIPVDSNCVPLALGPEFRHEPNAQAWLWKDHTSVAEAEEITAKAKKEPYLAKCGGAYSSEWFWSKILHCERVAPDVFQAAESWIECCDFVPAFLTGIDSPAKVKRSACAAGHKAMWNSHWQGLPSEKFLKGLSAGLSGLRARLYEHVYAIDQPAGFLDSEIALRSSLPAGIPVGVGAFDAHLGAVGSGIRPGMLVKIMGTSTCDIMVAPDDGSIPDIPGMCGIAEESVLPKMLGLEAGQSAVGDLFNWGASKLADGDHARLQREAASLRPGETGLVALDWNNGNRTILIDHALTGLLVGQTLATTAAEIYRALIEGTAFGALRIVQRIEEFGVPVSQIIACGGIAEKSPFVMQLYADILNRPIRVSRSGQTCALGAAISGSVVGGAHPNVEAAQDAMTGFQDYTYMPDPANRKAFDRIYGIYLELHDAFGGINRQADLGSVMKRLIALQKEARS